MGEIGTLIKSLCVAVFYLTVKLNVFVKLINKCWIPIKQASKTNK